MVLACSLTDLLGNSARYIVCAVSLLICVSVSGDEVHRPLPNILLIVADDLGWKDLGYQGSKIRTPHIDELAAAGVRMNRFYVQPSCSPTRGSLLTGNSALRLGMTSPLSKLNPGGLPLDQTLLPQYLKRKNYQTWLVGKWHLGFRQEEYLPTERGFEHFYGNLTGGIGYWDHVHGGAYDWQRNREVVRESGYSTHLLVREAVQLIEQRDSDRPLFLMASFNAPHLPNEAPDATVESYSHIKDPKRRLHAAMVTELDTAIGEIIDTLEQQGILDDTMVWFMSDNGGLNSSAFPERLVNALSALGVWFDGDTLPSRPLEFIRSNVLDGSANNAPLRKGKLSVYEGGVRVPSFVFWRNRLAPAEVSQMVTVEDVLPTLLGAVGTGGSKELSAELKVDGINQWQVLQGGMPASDRLFAVASGDGEALFQYPWKVIRLRSGDIELFNIDEDPREKRNLAIQKSALASELLMDLDSLPRGDVIHVPFWRALLDPDSFGGDEWRKPWLEIVE